MTKKKTITAKVKSDAPQAIVSVKGFDRDMTCRGFKFEVGGRYHHDGTVKICESGFHAVEYPLDVFRYYNPAHSRYAVVKQSGEFDRDIEDSKVASSDISIEREISLSELVDLTIEYINSKTTDRGAASNTGDRGAASNTGYNGAASNTGYSGAASNTGENGIAADFNGYSTRVKSCIGGAIYMVNRAKDGTIRHVFSSKVGENGIKPDTWYRLDNDGKPVEVED